MADPLAMVKVGNIECGFLKLTPLSRTSAIAGTVSGVTFSARNPSGTNRIRLWGVASWARALPADNSVRPAVKSMVERRIKISPLEANPAKRLPLFSFAVRRFCYITPRYAGLRGPAPLRSGSCPKRLQVQAHVQTNSDRKSRRDRLPGHQDRPEDGNPDRCRLFRGRPRHA